ncbi:MAG: T9SS type A sorting domain-containing protein [Saprospiraceae bacterium]
MKNTLYLLLILCLPCLLTAQQTINASIEHNGLTRDYILYVPATYDAAVAAPLVLNFHGYTSNATEQMFYGDFRPIADTAGFLLVHPMGTLDVLGNTHFNVGWGSSNVDDVGFTVALIDSLSANYTIDAARVYSTGMSNGGFMSYQLACALSDRIAAIASVTGTMNITLLNDCNPSHPVPIMEIHGTDDGTVAYNGSFIFAPVVDVLDFWVNFNNCDSEAVILDLPDLDPNDGTTVEHQVYANGDKGSSVEHYKVFDGGHTWPGAIFNTGVTNQDFKASKEIWRFFSQYNLDDLTSTTSIASVKPLNKTWKVYPNPAQAYLVIERKGIDVKPYSISTSLGQVVASGILQQERQEVDISSLANGMYYLKIADEVYAIVKNE